MYKIKQSIAFFALIFLSINTDAQDSTKKKFPVNISGVMGITYEGYGLNVNPSGSNIYTPRRPWNQVRFIFAPVLQIGKKFTLPLNINFATMATNFAGPYAGLKNQSIAQFISNPANNFAINPKYKWAELQLGTQYLKYSDLSTGDVGIFGAGFDLKPKTYRIKFFTGVSQQGINYSAIPLPGVTGAFKRNHWMFQLGKEEEGKYLLAFNFSKGKDFPTSSTPPPLTIKPQEGFVISVVTDVYSKNGFYFKAEAAQSTFTKDLTTALSPLGKSFKPFIDAHTSTATDYAGQASIGKKSKNFDIGVSSKYLGAGFQTTGYPYLQPDRLDYTINTRFNAWKNKSDNYRMNVVASIGQRVNNVSNTALKANQFIGNLNWFTQFDDHFSLNMNYNNFGFQSSGGINPFGIKNVSNDLGINPSYTWSNTKMNNLISLSYNYSKYDERDVISGITTSNNTHTALLTYVPTFLNSDVTPDFSLLYFYNDVPGVKIKLTTLSGGLSMPAAKKKIQLRAQLQYTLGKLNTFTHNKNFIASGNFDYKLSKNLTWNIYLTTNSFKYGNEIIPNGSSYLESTYRTGLQYRFNTKKN